MAFNFNLDRWLSQNDRNEPFVRRPWDTANSEFLDRVSSLQKLKIPPVRLILITAVCFIFLGFLFRSKAVFSLGLTLTAMVGYAFQSARKNTSAWSIDDISVNNSVPEGAEFALRFTVRNHSSTSIPKAVFYFSFLGSRLQHYFIPESSIAPNEAREVVIPLKADAGMGNFSLGKISVTVRDPLGLFYLCTQHSWETHVEVAPEFLPIEKFPYELRGLSVQMGNLRTRLSGESVEFLSLRDWRLGDAMKKIDWRKSLRMGELYVKDFERVVSADVTLLVDQCRRGHSEFGGVSSMEKLRDSIVSLVHFLSDEQLKIQLISDTHRVPFHLSERSILCEAASLLKPVADNHFLTMIEGAEAIIPPDSIAMLLFFTGNVAVDELLPTLLRLEDRKVQTFVIAFDSSAFAEEVAKNANLSGSQIRIARFNTPEDQRSESLDRLLAKISERTFIISPQSSLQDQCLKRSEL